MEMGEWKGKLIPILREAYLIAQPYIENSNEYYLKFIIMTVYNDIPSFEFFENKLKEIYQDMN
jgi:hypothetical protein